MKWQVATAKKRLLLLTLGVLLIHLGYSLARATDKADSTHTQLILSDKTQLGFYDILAEKQEIYNLQIKSSNGNNYIASLSMPENRDFTLKGKIIVIHDEDKNYSHLDFTPVYYHNPQANSMISSFVDYTTHHDSLIRDLLDDNSQLIVTKSGMLILMPETFSSPVTKAN